MSRYETVFAARVNRLAKQGCVRSAIVGLDHVDGEAVEGAGIGELVGDGGLGLAVAANDLEVEVEDVLVLLEQGLIGGGQEIVGGVVDGQPDLLGRAIILAELLLRGLVQSGGVDELCLLYTSRCV